MARTSARSWATGAIAPPDQRPSQIRPVFDQGDQLRASTGLPLLGVVSLVLSDTDRRRRRRGNLRFAGASGALVSLFAFGMIAMALLAQRAAG